MNEDDVNIDDIVTLTDDDVPSPQPPQPQQMNDEPGCCDGCIDCCLGGPCLVIFSLICCCRCFCPNKPLPGF